MPQLIAIRLNRALCDRAREAAAAAGYSSLEEFIEHAIAKHLAEAAPERGEPPEELIRQLKGLGYIE